MANIRHVRQCFKIEGARDLDSTTFIKQLKFVSGLEIKHKASYTDVVQLQKGVKFDDGATEI